MLQTVYFRETGKVIPVTKTQFRDTFEAGITNYEKNLVQTFTPHCETTLLRRLVHKRPTPIGVSEGCCPLCYQYFESVNASSMSKWFVGAAHGNVYNWSGGSPDNDAMAAGIKGVHEFVRREIVSLINAVALQSRTEESALNYLSSPEYDDDVHSDSYPPY